MTAERKAEQANSITVHMPWQRTDGAWCCPFHDPAQYRVATGNTNDWTAERADLDKMLEWKPIQVMVKDVPFPPRRGEVEMDAPDSVDPDAIRMLVRVAEGTPAVDPSSDFAPLPTESEPKREKCPQFYCPNHPAWIPAGQNGCPHCGGTATRGFCICETASADEIREMYTPPAPKTPSPAPESEPERETFDCLACGDTGYVVDAEGEEDNCPNGCPAPETPSPEVGMSRDEHEACREIERAVTWYEARSGRRVRNIGISRNDDGSVTAFWSLAAAKETK